MKLVKFSVLAAALIGSSAFGFGFENIKISGDAKLFYSTDDSTFIDTDGVEQGGLFDQESSAGQTALRLSLDADISEATKARVTLYGISTLGLEKSLVSNVWEGGTNANAWFGEAYVSHKIGETTGQIGRMELDTPLVFTERWSIVPNTFEAAVLINQDIPDTTLVGAYVGASNGAGLVKGTGATFGGVTVASDVIAVTADGAAALPDATVTSDARSNTFKPFYDGAFTVGAINNSWKPLTITAWYYSATHVTKAYWASADLDISGIQVGAQYAGIDLSNATKDALAVDNPAITKNKGSAFAGKLGYAMEDTFSVYGAFSSTAADSSRVGTNLGGSAMTNLYTQMFWSFGTVTQADTIAIKLYADYIITDAFNIGAQVVQADTKQTDLDDAMLRETALWGTYTYDAVDIGLAYINNATDNGASGAGMNGDYDNMIQLYLTYNY
jgi:hypothetical protein